MKHRVLITLVALSLVLFGCAEPAGTSPTDELPNDPIEPDRYSLQWLSGLNPDTVLIQQSYEPTFFRLEATYPFGRVPLFTLYADGTVIYISAGENYSQQQVFTAQVSQEQALDMLQEFMELGFMGLEDYLDMCMTEEDGSQVCIADDSYIILGATLPTGEYRTVKSYGNFSNDPAALEDIRLMLSDFKAPNGEPYAPKQATLFISELATTLDRFEFVWPLEPSLLRVDGQDTKAIVLVEPAIGQLVDAVGRNTGDFYFENEGKGFVVYLVPWLPGDDFYAQIEAEFPANEVELDETPALFPEPIFQIADAAIADLSERLVIDPEKITVYQVDQVDWPNGCLGIEIKDTFCTDAIVPGFRLLLDVAGVSYEYRSNMAGSVLMFSDPILRLPIKIPDAIQIDAPGPGSRIISPLVITGEADPAFEQTIVVRVLLADGRMVAQEPITIQADIGLRGPYFAEIPFSVDSEQQGFVQVFVVSARDGGITHLNSVGVTLAVDGLADIRPAASTNEQIRIDRPAVGETIHSGIVHVEGFATASFEQTLVIDILDETGLVLMTVPAIVQAPDLGMPGEFSVDISLEIVVEGAGRIVVRDPSPAFGGDSHITSVEVRFVP